MNDDILKGQWNELQGKIKKQWGKLTDQEITQIQGSTQELIGKLQKSYGINKEQAQEQINNFIKQNRQSR